MSAVMQFLETTFGPLVFVFTVANLAAMGLQVRMPEVAAALRNKKSLALIFVWGWVAGPAFGYLITGWFLWRSHTSSWSSSPAWRPARRSCSRWSGKPAATWALPAPSFRSWRSARCC